MPIFEFVCTECGAPFEELVRSANYTEEVLCPSCGGDQVKKQISTFAARVTGGGTARSFSSAASSCNTGSV
jgi:putative FmdB family regulatory protein